MSTCVNALVNTVILLTILSRRGITIHIGALSWVGIKALLAATLMGGAAYGVYSLLINYLPASFALMTAIAVGGGAYLLLVALMLPKTLREVLADFRFRRKRR